MHPEFAALRAASSRYKLVEEQQFIEQHAWANAAHPMHQIHRQSSVQQGTRTSSPFMNSSGPIPRPQQTNGGGPPIGTFPSVSSSTLPHLNGSGRISPHMAFSSSMNAHKILPSPLGGSRQASPILHHTSHQMQPQIQYTERALPHQIQNEQSQESTHANLHFGSYGPRRDFGYDGGQRVVEQLAEQNGR